MKTVVILSGLNLWSIEIGKGAPSFFNTVKGYMDAGWNTILINPDTDEAIKENMLTQIQHYQVSPYLQQQPENKIGKWLYNNKVQKYYNDRFEEILNSILPNLDPRTSILYAYEVMAVPVAKKMSEKYHLKFVTRFQGTILYNKKHNIINRIAYIHHYKALTTPSDLVIMTNDGTFGEQVLIDLGNKSRCCFWRNGINRPHFIEEKKEEPEENEEIKLLTVSRLANWKRVDRAVSAMPEVLEAFPNSKLYVVGDGAEKENLIALAERLRVSDNVIFVGSIPQKDVFVLMKKANIFLSLYDLGNVGNPLYEAMICGKAIVTLDNGDTSSVIVDDKNGVLLDMSQADNSAPAIVSLQKDPDRLHRLERGAKKYADENFWTWEERIQEELKVVTKLLSE